MRPFINSSCTAFNWELSRSMYAATESGSFKPVAAHVFILRSNSEMYGTIPWSGCLLKVYIASKAVISERTFDLPNFSSKKSITFCNPFST